MNSPNVSPALPRLTFPSIVSQLRETFAHFPDGRKPGNNTHYTLSDAALSAFSAFFMQCPSFLDYQRRMSESQGRNNVQSLFGAHAIPCDNQIRHLLDGTPPATLDPAFGFILHGLQQDGYLKSFPLKGYGWLLLLDGTQHFSSSHIHCPHCLERHHANGTVTYQHQALTPVLANPDSHTVINLTPEFITREDGQDKQDCELSAAKRWLARFDAGQLPGRITLLGDDLYCHQPFCQAVHDAGNDFIFTCKRSSHPTLYEWLDSLGNTSAAQTVQVRRWTGSQHLTDTYRFALKLPLRDGAEQDTLSVNWCELTTTRDNGKVVYHNAFATSHPISHHTVAALVRAGRCRWKIENENNNTLKTQGYHFEHNFGHGKQQLSNLLATLALLAFLIHSTLTLFDQRFGLLRQKLSRQSLFQAINVLTTFLYFDSWGNLLEFMLQGLRKRHVLADFFQGRAK